MPGPEGVDQSAPCQSVNDPVRRLDEGRLLDLGGPAQHLGGSPQVLRCAGTRSWSGPGTKLPVSCSVGLRSGGVSGHGRSPILGIPDRSRSGDASTHTHDSPTTCGVPLSAGRGVNVAHRESTSGSAGTGGTGTEHVRQPHGRSWSVSVSAVSVAPRSGMSATTRMSTALTDALLRRSTHPGLPMEEEWTGTAECASPGRGAAPGWTCGRLRPWPGGSPVGPGRAGVEALGWLRRESGGPARCCPRPHVNAGRSAARAARRTPRS
jgi:hypothetical protein